MSSAYIAAIAAAGGALGAASVSAAINFLQGREALREGHLIRAFERHLPEYERIFVTARSAQDALRAYVAIEKQAADRFDPFLRQLLQIFSDRAYQYCLAVDWQHNSGMVYLEIKLEERCLSARDLLLQWLSRRRLTFGDMAKVRNGGTMRSITMDDARLLGLGDYEELRIERSLMVVSQPGDGHLLAKIDRALSSVIVELKAVMSH